MTNKNEKIEESDLITLRQASELTEYTAEHLNLLCRKGILKGKKVGRNWYTTKKWLAEFVNGSEAVDGQKEYKRRKKIKESLIEETQNILSEVPVKVLEQKNEIEEVELPKFELSNIENSKSNIEFEKPEPKVVEKLTIVEVPKYPTPLRDLFKMFSQFSLMIVIAFFVFFGAAFLNYFRDTQSLKKLPSNLEADTFLTTDKNGMVMGEENVKGEEDVKTAIASSENFQMKEISFGGVLVASANSQNVSLEISDVKSENFMSKDGNAQTLITWKTNKLAISDIEYSRREIDSPINLNEKYYGFNHSVVLSKLELGTSYVYQINCKDQWGNENSSEKFGLFTGTKALSVFELIVKALTETFGWAMKK